MSKDCARRPYPGSAASPLWLGLLVCAACGSTDGAMLLRPGAGSGGATAGDGGDSGSGGSAGTGGSGGATERDAGADATADASHEPSCVVGSLADYCAIASGVCPASYADARARLQMNSNAQFLRLILQEACTGPDGAPRIRVSGDYYSMSQSYIFDPSTGQLVSVFIYDDLGGCSAPLRADSEAFGSVSGFYGEESPGCAFQYSDYTVPPACRLPADWRNLDAGALRAALVVAGADAGSLDDGGPYECVVAP